MRPLSQLAAALARRGRGACGPGCAPPHAAHIAGSAARPSSGAALLRRSGAAPAGRGAARTVAAAPPRRAGCKLWWRPRGAVSASAPGSPLYRVSAPPPAPHTPPPRRRRRAAPPGASGRGQGSGPAPLSRPGCSGAAPPALRPGRPLVVLGKRLAAPLGSPSPLRLRCPFLRTFSPGSCPLRGVLRQPARLGGLRPEQSAHGGVAGLRQEQLSGSEAAPAARLLPSLRSPPLCCPPLPPPPVPTDSRAPAPPAATTTASRLRARLPGHPHHGRFLKSRGGRGQRDLGIAPPFSFPPAPWPQRLLAYRVGNECDSKFQVDESPASLPRVVGISGITWGPGEGVMHVYASPAALDSWRGALPPPVTPNPTPAVTRTPPRSRAHTRALSYNTERTRPRASSILELPPGCAPGLAAASPVPFSPACVLIFSS
jgi:hypothetical protein|eukprot:XP_011245401.2 PREDICTED: nascent polypeptide-associated complex subunit alpha, muscle-specific form-like [Mus musculus]